MSEKVYRLRDAMLGGPGLDGYAYQADVYCKNCGGEVIREVFHKRPEVDWMTFCDSEEVPQPIFFGEHEEDQHCANCDKRMYGGNI